ncbi:tetrapyrrole biosynthesis, uroporphyrinogen III synthase [Helicostylum pulchrum]|nr:tetrapyrrole biosynthesis, uroporphyrinogen III synthase [Helicostylum pulchrum]
MTKKKTIVLFKKKDTIDEYHDLFLQYGYVPEFIPVLDHETKNIEPIKDMLLLGPHRANLNGLILTSQRSVEAMSEAFNLLRSQGLTLSQQVVKEWNDLPVYMVGPQTAKVLSQLVALFNTGHKHHWMIYPRAAELIQPLIDGQRQFNGKGRLLFLAGDKRRDLIPTELTKAQLDFLEIQSYETCVHKDLKCAMQNFVSPDWVVYFSPSGLKFLLSCVEGEARRNLLAACQKREGGAYTKIAAIGPTTFEYILEELGVQSDVVAEEPDAQHLVNDIISFDRS